MRKFLKFAASLVLLAVVAFCVYAAMQPDSFEVARSTAISAPPEKIFAQVNDLHKWEAWSPWAKLDPTAAMTYAGPGSGVGASMHWAGNAGVGEGTMTIIESNPQKIGIRLDFVKPIEGTDESDFTFAPQAGGTLVTWSMHGKKNFVGKAMGLIFGCEKMVGDQYDKGLASLRAIAEAK